MWGTIHFLVCTPHSQHPTPQTRFEWLYFFFCCPLGVWGRSNEKATCFFSFFGLISVVIWGVLVCAISGIEPACESVVPCISMVGVSMKRHEKDCLDVKKRCGVLGSLKGLLSLWQNFPSKQAHKKMFEPAAR